VKCSHNLFKLQWIYGSIEKWNILRNIIKKGFFIVHIYFICSKIMRRHCWYKIDQSVSFIDSIFIFSHVFSSPSYLSIHWWSLEDYRSVRLGKEHNRPTIRASTQIDRIKSRFIVYSVGSVRYVYPYSRLRVEGIAIMSFFSSSIVHNDGRHRASSPWRVLLLSWMR